MIRDVRLRGSEIGRRRQFQAWSQEKLAEMVGYGVRTIQRAESGKPLRVTTAADIAQALGCKLEELLVDSGPAEPAGQEPEVDTLCGDLEPTAPVCASGEEPGSLDTTGPWRARMTVSITLTAVVGLLFAAFWATWPAPRSWRELEVRAQIVLGVYPTDSDRLELLLQLRDIYNEDGRLEDALRVQREVMATRVRISGPENPQTTIAKQNTARLLERLGRCREALPLYDEVVARLEQLGTQTDLGPVLNNRSIYHVALGALDLKKQDQETASA